MFWEGALHPFWHNDPNLAQHGIPIRKAQISPVSVHARFGYRKDPTQKHRVARFANSQASFLSGVRSASLARALLPTITT